jgi:hypothetical protein
MACIDEMQELSADKGTTVSLPWTRGDTEVHSFFWYAGAVRRQIIGAKAGGDIHALKGIVKVWAKELSDLPIIKEVDSVMPCPSSLWSRMHGRIDIAWFLAAHASEAFGLTGTSASNSRREPTSSALWTTLLKSLWIRC